MQTTKRVVITLDDGDEIEVQFRGRSFIVSAESDRGAGPILHFPGGAEMIFDPREGPEPVNETARRLLEDMRTGMVAQPDGTAIPAEELGELEHRLTGSLMEDPLPRNASIFV
jgi:hypothetical protein